MEPRHTRQVRLAGVGAEGQARIARAVVDVPGHGLAAEVAARYLAGAGVGCVRVHDAAAAAAARAVNAGVRVEVVEEGGEREEKQKIKRSKGESPSDLLIFCFSQLEDPSARAVASGALLALAALRAALDEGA
jgi:hypothetical protein